MEAEGVGQMNKPLRESSDAYQAYYEAYSDLQHFIARHPIGKRTPDQSKELERLDGICTIAKLRWENSQGRK